MGEPAPAPKLEVRDLSVGYNDAAVQQRVSFDVGSGSIFAIMGISGCGKSTVLRALMGLQRPLAGTIRFAGEDYWAAPDTRRAELGRRFGVLFQGSALWSSLTAAENVALPLRMFTTRSAASIEALVEIKLSLVGLDSGRDSLPADLSGGMQKRVGLARALSLDPEVLFLDEPSGGLDPISARRFDTLIRQLRDGFGVTVVMVSHELPSLLAICDDGVFLDAESHTAIAHGAPAALRDTCATPVVRAFMNAQGVAGGKDPRDGLAHATG
jgi:phospholipid/cholesterol/gamma-HCH transport system ATP-binding protein